MIHIELYSKGCRTQYRGLYQWFSTSVHRNQIGVLREISDICNYGDKI